MEGVYVSFDKFTKNVDGKRKKLLGNGYPGRSFCDSHWQNSAIPITPSWLTQKIYAFLLVVIPEDILGLNFDKLFYLFF